MTETIKLANVAHARAGDKGDTSIIVIAPLELLDYERLKDVLTIERIRAHFGVINSSHVLITPIDGLQAIAISVQARLAGGVTRSPTTDPHGKTLSGHLLDMTVPWCEYRGSEPSLI